ncbi:MAG: hypothetical protein WDA59_00090 [Methanofastidiosum sp.]
MKTIDLQQENIKHLLKLVEENPELEIMPMVDTEIVCDDSYNWWAGSWGKAEVEECWFSDERIYFKSQDYDELINDKADLIWNDNQNLEDSELLRKAKEIIDAYDWQKMIVVRIELP